MVMESTGNAAVFVDRDGTLIKEVGYLSRLEQIEILPLVPEAIQLFHQQGLKVASRQRRRDRWHQRLGRLLREPV